MGRGLQGLGGNLRGWRGKGKFIVGMGIIMKSILRRYFLIQFLNMQCSWCYCNIFVLINMVLISVPSRGQVVLVGRFAGNKLFFCVTYCREGKGLEGR